MPEAENLTKKLVIMILMLEAATEVAVIILVFKVIIINDQIQ